jgi:hypothetical protein
VLSGWSSLISKYGCLPGVKKTKNIKNTCKKAFFAKPMHSSLCIVCESFLVKLTFVEVHDKKEANYFH